MSSMSFYTIKKRKIRKRLSHTTRESYEDSINIDDTNSSSLTMLPLLTKREINTPFT